MRSPFGLKAWILACILLRSRLRLGSGGSGIVSKFKITYRMIVSRSSQLIDKRKMESVSPYLLDINVKVYLQCRIRQLAEPTKREKAGQWP